MFWRILSMRGIVRMYVGSPEEMNSEKVSFACSRGPSSLGSVRCEWLRSMPFVVLSSARQIRVREAGGSLE